MMRRILSLLLAILLSLEVLPAQLPRAAANDFAVYSYDGTTLIYADLGAVDWWRDKDAVQKLYFYGVDETGAETDAWADLSPVEPGGSIYCALVPAGDWSHVILARMNPKKIGSVSDPWDACWNRTDYLSLVPQNNYLTSFAELSDSARWVTFDRSIHLKPCPRTNQFRDVKASSFYYRPVLWAVDNGITEGTTATTFSPKKSCTRAELVTFLWRAAGCPAPTQNQNPFSDVSAKKWYSTAVLWAVENGITTGMTPTSFGPKKTCTRAQVVTMLWKRSGSPRATQRTVPFTDIKPGSYYYEAVLWAYETGITGGTSATTFSPKSNCTRGQIMTFLFNAKLGEYELQELSSDNLTAQVTASVNYGCDLRINLLTEANAELFFSAKQPVESGMTLETLSASLPAALPDGYLLEAQLLDYDGKELTKLTSIHYTQAYAQFDAQKPEDFSNRVVLDFYGDGFAVAAEGAVPVPETAAEVSEGCYRIASDTAPVQGDRLVLTLENGGKLVILVDQVELNSDGTYTVTQDPEAGVADLYDVIKIDSTLDLVSASQEASSSARLSDSRRPIESAAAPLNLFTISGAVSSGPFTGKASMTIALDVSVHYDKKLLGEDYFELEVAFNQSLTASLTLTGAFNPLGETGLSGDRKPLEIVLWDGPIFLIGEPIPYGSIQPKLTIPLDLSFSASGTASITQKKRFGYAYNTLDGTIRKLDDAPDANYTLNLTGSCSFSTGPKFSAEILLLGVIKVSPSVQYAVKVSGTAKTNNLADPDPETKHLCSVCVGFDLSFVLKGSVSVGFSLLKSKLAPKIKLEVVPFQDSLGKAYWSKELGFHLGKCPNDGYRVQIQVCDGYGKPISEGNISVTGASNEPVSKALPFKDYLINGTYSVSASVVDQGNRVNVTDQFTVNSAPLLMVLYTEPTVHLCFDPTEGRGAMSEQIAPIRNGSAEFTLPACGFTRPAGKQFRAWSVNGSEYQPGDLVHLTADSTAEAVWEDVIFTVRFLPGEGSGTMTECKVKENESLSLPYCSFTAPKDKYFKAWQLSGKEYQEGASIVVRSDLTLTALWDSAVMLTPKQIYSWDDSSYGRYHLRGFIAEDDSLWMWGTLKGSNGYVYLNSAAPRLIMRNVSSVQFEGSLVIIQKDGGLWGWGPYNILTSTTGNRHVVPEKVMNGVAKFYRFGSSSYYNWAVIKTDKSLWMWGNNKYGQIGNGEKSNSAVTEPVQVLDKVSHFSMSGYTSCALCEDGSLWIWGDDKSQYKKTLIPGSENTTKPFRVMTKVSDYYQASYYIIALRQDASVWSWGGYANDLVTGTGTEPVRLLTDIKSFTAYNSSLTPSCAAIAKDGSLWVWGNTSGYNLGCGVPTDPEYIAPTKILDHVSSVILRESNGAAIKADGSLWTWGSNSTALTGTNQYGGNVLRPTKIMDNVIGMDFSGGGSAIQTDGSLWRWGASSCLIGNGKSGTRVLAPSKIAENVTYIYATPDFYCIVRKDGSFWTWGTSYVGNGTTGKCLSPVLIGTGS